MKKSKLLTPILSVTGLVGMTTPLMVATGCSHTTIKELNVTLAGGLTSEPEIGTVVTKANFVVTAKYSDDSEKQINDWKCGKFSTAGTYTFSTYGDDTLTIESNGLTKDITFNTVIKSDLVLNYPLLGLSVGTTTESKAYTTSAYLKVYSNGCRLQPTDVTMVSKDTSKVTVNNESGLVTAVAATDANTPVIIEVALKGTTKKVECKVVVADYYQNVVCNTDNTASVAVKALSTQEFGGLFAVDNWINVTDSTTNATTQYTITALTKGNADIEKLITTLYLPSSVTDIGDTIFTTENSILQDVYYGGTKSQLENTNITVKEFGDQIIGVQCTDGFSNFTHRKNSVFKEESSIVEGKKVLAMEEAVGAIVGRTFIARFDYTLVPEGETAEHYNIIQFYDTSFQFFLELSISAVYLNGVKLTKDSEQSIYYTYDSNSGSLQIWDKSATNDPTAHDLTDANVVVKFWTPARALNGVYAGALYHD